MCGGPHRLLPLCWVVGGGGGSRGGQGMCRAREGRQEGAALRDAHLGGGR